MIKFERGKDPKETLDIGIKQSLPIWMKEDPGKGVYSHKNVMDVWMWALESKKPEYMVVLPYIVSQHGESWYGNIIDVSGYANEMLWEAVSIGNLIAVEAVLTIPNLFPEEAMTLEFGTTLIKEINPATGNPYRTALFGNIVNLAKSRGFSFLVGPLEKYYHNEYNRIRERQES